MSVGCGPRSVLMLAQHHANQRASALNRGEHILDVRASHSEDMANAELQQSVGDEV